jgi:uncharacterized protein YfaS (alpha-2-macroglobulin family)
MLNIYEVGQRVRCAVTFTVNGTNTDPTTVKAKVKDPSGNITTYTYGSDTELVKDVTGQYHIDVDTDERGEWHIRFEGTGTCMAVEESAFRVRTSFPVSP